MVICSSSNGVLRIHETELIPFLGCILKVSRAISYEVSLSLFLLRFPPPPFQKNHSYPFKTILFITHFHPLPHLSRCKLLNQQIKPCLHQPNLYIFNTLRANKSMFLNGHLKDLCGWQTCIVMNVFKIKQRINTFFNKKLKFCV